MKACCRETKDDTLREMAIELLESGKDPLFVPTLLFIVGKMSDKSIAEGVRRMILEKQK